MGLSPSLHHHPAEQTPNAELDRIDSGTTAIPRESAVKSPRNHQKLDNTRRLSLPTAAREARRTAHPCRDSLARFDRPRVTSPRAAAYHAPT
jgi:hypothetical protein